MFREGVILLFGGREGKRIFNLLIGDTWFGFLKEKLKNSVAQFKITLRTVLIEIEYISCSQFI